MNEVLQDPVRHNNWATRRLVDFCREASLTDEQLKASGHGAFGGILETLDHITWSDAHYLRRLLGDPPPWTQPDREVGLEGMAALARETEKRWEELLAAPIDVERVVVVDDGANEVRAGIFIAQALNHANLHREQVCAILTSFGIEPPDIQAWEYAWASGRLWERTSTH